MKLLNVGFFQVSVGGVTRTRALLTHLDRAEFEKELGPGETLESFLYASPPGPTWPCGPSGEEWEYLCDLAWKDARVRRALQKALAASRHRYLAMEAPETVRVE